MTNQDLIKHLSKLDPLAQVLLKVADVVSGDDSEFPLDNIGTRDEYGIKSVITFSSNEFLNDTIQP